ncbi:MAG: bifunctional phosphopantothenoylcysteine decarboxylase/phosphopantothenate--cysteine ligase CoaBC, partial [bacterium]
NVIGKIASGIADEILTTIVLATEAPVVIAPAMDQGMYRSPILQRNIAKLKAAGYRFIGPEKGDLASGEVGMGRMTEPPKIVESLENLIQSRDDFRGKTFLVTAGPTRERLDRVRFFSNYSSGKMGYALAEEGRSRGAKIILVSGPSSLIPPGGVEFYRVESAQEMYDAVMGKFPKVDGVLMAAAVSDYRPARPWQNKIKKESREKLVVELVQNPDILKELGEKRGGQILVGFCAETKDLEKEARKKLISKGLDLVVANDVTLEGAGFEVDTNVVTLIDRGGKKEALSRRSKREVAQKIWDKIKLLMEARKVSGEMA